jgi:uncharacterized membrane protein
MFCHKCGSQVSSDTRFCTICGTELLASSTLAPVWTPPVGVQVRAGHWVAEGWRLVQQDLGTFILLALVLMVLSAAIPVVLQGPLLAGFYIFSMKKLTGRRTEFADMFKGFNFFVPALVASLIIGLFAFVGFLACIIPGLVVAAMYSFTFLFIVDKRMDFWPAMQASHAVVKQDYVGFTLFVLLLALIGLLGFLCCFVGLFVTVPVTYAAIAVAYKELVGFDPHALDAL